MTKITIIEREKPIFKKINFACDGEIHPKLNNIEMLKQYFNKQNTTLIVGSQGSGKTSLALSLITHKKCYKKCFNYVYVFCPPTSRASFQDSSPLKDLPEDRFYDDLNESSIEDVYQKISENTENGHFSLVLFDDLQRMLKSGSVTNRLKDLIANQRHLRAVFIITLQNYLALDKQIRNIANNLIFFKLSKPQLEMIEKEFWIQGEKVFYDMVNHIFRDDRPHTWIMLPRQQNRQFNEFDEIIITTGDIPR